MAETEYWGVEGIQNVQLAAVSAYEIVTRPVGDQRSVLGHVVENERDGERQWIAWAVLGAKGDSFLGTFRTAHLAIWALYDNERELARGREDAEAQL